MPLIITYMRTGQRCTADSSVTALQTEKHSSLFMSDARLAVSIETAHLLTLQKRQRRTLRTKHKTASTLTCPGPIKVAVCSVCKQGTTAQPVSPIRVLYHLLI